MNLVGFTVEIYFDARLYEGKKRNWESGLDFFHPTMNGIYSTAQGVWRGVVLRIDFLQESTWYSWALSE